MWKNLLRVWCGFSSTMTHQQNQKPMTMRVAMLLLCHFLCVAITHITSRSCEAFIIVPVIPWSHRRLPHLANMDRLEHKSSAAASAVAGYGTLLAVVHPSNDNVDTSDNDDDGWASADGGDTVDDLDSSTTDNKKSNSNQINKELQLATIADLQQQSRRRTVASSSSRQLKGEAEATTETERDLFIPIFALVSLAGLFGAYGYEMVRLYFRGELYLPGGMGGGGS